MPEVSTHLVMVVAAFLVAGIVKGIIGLGLPTVAIGLLSLLMPPAQAAAILTAPSFVTNVWQAVVGGRLFDLLKRFWVMLAGVVIGIFIGAGMLTGANTTLAVTGLGIALIAYAVWGLFGVPLRVSPSAERWLSPIIGIVTGLVTGATGVFVIPAVPYLQALEMERDELVQALGIFFLTSTIALTVVLYRAGLFQTGGVAAMSLIAIVPAVIGMWIGQKIREFISPKTFRIVMLCGVLILGLHLASRALI